MNILWILPGILLAGVQFLLSGLFLRLQGLPARISLMLGKLLLWLLCFLLLVRMGTAALLFAGIAAMAAYTLLAVGWMLRKIKREKEV